jgi:hypothetical protein
VNFGLTQPQDPSSLPVSRAPVPVTETRQKTKIPATCEKISACDYIITSGWEMAEERKVIPAIHSLFSPDFNTSDWYNATVPGTVLTTLVDQGVYPDPLFGLNNMYIPDTLCRTDWWYRRVLDLPEGAGGKTLWLLFNGINYRAEIWMNGVLLGRIDGAFSRGLFNITGTVRYDSPNVIAVHIIPPSNPGIPHEESLSTGPGPNGGQLCMDGPTFIASEGWDWVPAIRDRNIGIWQDVKLRVTGPVTLTDPQVITDLPLPDTSIARVTVRTGIRNSLERDVSVRVNGTIGSVSFSMQKDLPAGASEIISFDPDEYKQLIFEDPQLWWPGGYGQPSLYDLHLSVVTDDGSLSDVKDLRFGIREYTYELAVADDDGSLRRFEFDPLLAGGRVIFNSIDRVDAGGGVSVIARKSITDTSALKTIDHKSSNPFLVIRVNGIPVYCRGGNWGMDDAMKRVSRERMEPYMKLHRESGLNMIRNWTGESTGEVFYQLCDEYGMMVWNDFWLSTEGYNLSVNDNDLFMANATEVVKRFRNHPSIAVWCPRNEGYAPPALELRLQKLIAENDGTRLYHGNSRHLNLRPSGPWHFYPDPSRYADDAGGFNTEIGIPSVPAASSMRSMMAEEDLWPVSDVWAYHDFHNGQKSYCATIEDLYGEPTGVDDFCKKAQMVNYESHRAMFEAWNSRLWNNVTGVLLWMSHPAWPSTDWQTYSWDYETPGSYFGTKKACEHLHIQMTLHDMNVSVVNTTLKRYERLKVVCDVHDITGKRINSLTEFIDVNENSVRQCFNVSIPPELSGVYLVRLTLLEGTNILSKNDYWQSSLKERKFVTFNTIGQGKLTARSLPLKNGNTGLMILNRGKVPVIGIKLNLMDSNTGEIILPAYFSDGYFNLLPGEKRIIETEQPYRVNRECYVTAEGYNLGSMKLLKF